ncbi:MAG: DUF6010 family protein [Dermatophilaceae bacterium]
MRRPRVDRRTYLLHGAANLLGSVAFIVGVGLVDEPWRQYSMAAVVTLAAFVYVGGGFGRVEWYLAAVMASCGVIGLVAYPALGVAWLVHSVVDIAHHRIGHPLVRSAPMSAFGCTVFDIPLAVWFVLGAPTVIAL